MPAVTDHRGKRVTLYGLLTDRPRELDDGAMPFVVQSAIDRDARSAGGGSPVPPIAIAAVCVVIFAGVWAGLYMLFGPPISLTGVFMGSAVAWGIAAMITLPFRRYWYSSTEAAPIVAAFLKHRRCPACGYDLAGCEPDFDDCTVCPECAAAWNVPTAPPAPLPPAHDTGRH